MLQSASRGGGSPWQGGFSLAGGVLPGRGGVLPGRGDSPWQEGSSWQTPLPPVNRMTNRCKHITLATTSLRPVKMYVCKDILCKWLSVQFSQCYLQVTFHVAGWPNNPIQHHLAVSDSRKEVECIVAGRLQILLQLDGNNATAALFVKNMIT